MNNCGSPYEILLINDGSTDGSERILSQLHNDNIRCIFKENQGLGSVFQLGFTLASGQIFIILDLDLSYGVQNIYKVIDLAKDWDCVVCSKYADMNDYPLHRQILSLLNYLFCRCVFKISVRDMGSGLVMVHKHLVQNESFICSGFGIHCEFFFLLHKKNARILEIPVQYKHYPGTYRSFFHSCQTINELKSILFKK
jgi:glycosyltransferase involved in cell wall biosynthesis